MARCRCCAADRAAQNSHKWSSLLSAVSCAPTSGPGDGTRFEIGMGGRSSVLISNLTFSSNQVLPFQDVEHGCIEHGVGHLSAMPS